MENTQIQKRTIAQFLNVPSTQKFLEETLSDKKGEFISNLIAITDSDENLAACDPAKLMKCAMNATALNLPLNKNLGYAYVIAYKAVPSFQIGYKGYIQLALRTGQYEFLNAVEVREGELIRNKITGEIKFIGEKPENKVVGYIAYLKLRSGFQASIYMTEAEIEAHAVRFSKSYAYDLKNKTMSSKWSDPLARPKMALKTVLKGLLGTYGLMTTEIAKAFDSDDNSENEIGQRVVEDAEIIPQSEPTETPKKVKI